MTWHHTHTICVVEHYGASREIEVYDCDGAWYTREEWQADARADWEYDERGLLHQGDVPMWCRSYSWRHR